MTRREDGLWQEKLPIKKNGRTTYKYFYGRTKTAVNKKIAAFKDAEEKGATFGTVADEWWEQHAKTLAHTTLSQYEPAIARAKKRFGNSYIRTIKPTDISAFLRSVIKERSMADKTARTQLMMINLICKYAVEVGYIEVNPAHDLSVPRGLPKTQRTMPEDEIIQKVKDSTDAPFGMFAYWLLYTGLRRGELLALSWEDIDLELNTITVNKSIYYDSDTPNLKQPKTAAGSRTVPLLAKLKEKLEPQKSGIIFPGNNGGYMPRMQYQRRWIKYTEATGVDCSAHQLRHAFATLLFENDIAVKDAQHILGHAQASTTQDVYTEIRKSRERSVYDKLLNADLV